jgi:O-acetyl-ADP-ribose deacetylase
MFNNDDDCMHFYFAKYDHEIAIVSIDLEVEWIRTLTKNINVYNSFEQLLPEQTSVVILATKPIDMAQFKLHNEISYAFFGWKTFIAPTDGSVISICAEDEKSLESLFESLCASAENTNVINMDPVEPSFNGHSFFHIADVSNFNTFNFSLLKNTPYCWLHHRSQLIFESIMENMDHINTISGLLCNTGITSDDEIIRIIGSRACVIPKYPIKSWLFGIYVCFDIGDIAQQKCDAIVNSANIYLQKGSGVCGTLFEGAGEELTRACREHMLQLKRPLRIAEAVITPGFNLNAKSILHIVSPRCMFRWNETMEEKLFQTYKTILEVADENAFDAIAIPALGLGVHHCDPIESTRIAISAIYSYAQQKEKNITKITFVLSDERTAEMYVKIFYESFLAYSEVAYED